MTKQSVEGFPLSPQQRRIWRLPGDAGGRLAQGVVRLEGELEPDRLRRAVRQLVARHEILRTRFPRLPGMELPIQVIEKGAGERLREAAANGRDPSSWLDAESGSFDFEDGPPGRFLLVPESDDRHLLVLTFSSLVADPRTFDNLSRELAALYRRMEEVTEEPVQYADFADWQNELQESEEEEERRSFWRRVPYHRMDLGALRAMPAPDGDSGASPVRSCLDLDAPLAGEIDALAERLGVGIKAVLLAAWQLLLGRLTGERRPLVGHWVDGRRIEGLEEAVGTFGRYLPLVVPLPDDLQVSELIEAIERAIEEGETRQEVFSFELYAGEAPIEGFQVLFEYRRAAEPIEAGGVRFRPLEVRAAAEPCQARLSAVASGDGLELRLELDPSAFDAADAERFLARYRGLLVGLSGRLDARVGEIGVRTPAEAEAVAEWNRTDAEAPIATPVHRHFEERARRAPDAAALSCGGATLSFDALERRANRLARHLLRLGLSPEERVLVALERSAEQIVTLLAVLKAGGVFVPLDLAQPAARLADMVEDAGRGAAGRRLLLVHAGDAPPGLDGLPVRTVDLTAAAAEIAALESGAPDLEVAPDRLAYALFTSGSSGRPKAVAVCHRSVVNLWAALRGVHGGGVEVVGSRRVALNAPLTFDASVKQWIQLLSGAALEVVPERVRGDGDGFREWLARHRLDALDATPSQLRLLVAAGLLDAPPAERPATLLVGGEAVAPDLWQALAATPGTASWNVYGPTECTVDSTAVRIDATGHPTLGRPVANVRIHVVDAALRPVPLGVPGELTIAGAGLARGYLDRPAATAERFVPDPFAERPGGRLYRSGDRARRWADGRAEYLGRLDHQVKLRGVRIELGEIEAAFADHPAVRSAAVDVRTDEAGGQELVAYLVPSALHDRAASGRWVSFRLPDGRRVAAFDAAETEYMVHEIFARGSYLPAGEPLPPGAVVFDVGANIGLFSLFVAERCPSARIYAFEPVPPIFEALRHNVQLHLSRAEIFPFGLGQSERSTEFTFYPRFSARSGLAEYADLENEIEITRRYVENLGPGNEDELAEDDLDQLLARKLRSEQVRGRVRRLSDIVREKGVERIDLLKIDVQRAELDVLRGIDDEHWELIRRIAMEVHDEPGTASEGRLREIGELLESHGFRVSTFQEDVLEGTDRHFLVAMRPEMAGGVLERHDFGVTAEQDPEAALTGLHTRDSARGARRAERREEPVVRLAESLTEPALRAYLGSRLPAFMIPARFVLLDELPYNRNGKLDRRALPDPSEMEGPDAGETATPRTPAEEVVVGLFTEVLGRERVGVDESFFDLGGHSLLATQLMSRVREAFQAELPLRVLFEAPTAEALARRALEAREAGADAGAPELEPVPREGPLPLSYAQQALWLLHRMEPESASYNSLKALRLKGALEPRVVAAVLTEVVRRHEVLRTRFPVVDDVPEQRIEPPSPVALPVVDLSALPEDCRGAESVTVARREARRPFDLASETPLRCILLRRGIGDHVLVFELHHIAADGWSLAVLDREVEALYRAFGMGRPSPLPDLPVQYADYAAWQRSWLKGDALDAEIDFWKRQLAGAPAELDLPTERPAAEAARRGASRGFVLPAELSRELAAASREHGTTLYLTLLTGFYVVLHHVTGHDDMVVGTAAAGRGRRRIEDLVGLFINMLPLRIDLSDDPTLAELLARVRGVGLSAFAHQNLPFEKLVEVLGRERKPGRNPIFQVAFGLNNAPPAELDLPGLEVEPLEVEHEEPRLDLTVWISETPDGLRALWTYDRSLLADATVERLQERFVEVLRLLVDEPDLRVRDVEILGEEERREMEERKRRRESSNRRRLRQVKRRKIGAS